MEGGSSHDEDGAVDEEGHHQGDRAVDSAEANGILYFAAVIAIDLRTE